MMSRSASRDWVCSNPKCKNVNFAKREACNLCGAPKKYSQHRNTGLELGKHAAEKSKGLFSPDDWACKACGNVNWARRNTCNMCNSPKVDVQGERTGYGGGYMERDEVVEYRDRGDSDDEFDEFGRRKKRFRKSDADEVVVKGGVSDLVDQVRQGNSNTRGTAVNVNTDDENEEDEEESGDDADLSKYDIWGAENEDDGTTSHATNERKNYASSKSPRSRSSSSSSDSDSSSSSSSISRASRSGSSSSSSSHSGDSAVNAKQVNQCISPLLKTKTKSSIDKDMSQSNGQRVTKRDRSRSPLLTST